MFFLHHRTYSICDTIFYSTYHLSDVPVYYIKVNEKSNTYRNTYSKYLL